MARLFRYIHGSVSLKLLILFVLVLLLAVLVILIPLRAEMRAQIVLDLQNELRAIASTTAAHIDGDALATVRAPADASTPAFRALQAQLRLIRAANVELTQDNIYTIYRDKGGTLRFGVMTHDTPFVGDECPAQPEARTALATGTVQVTDLYRDTFGEWISAFAPIFGSSGQVVGLIDVNRRSDRYFARYHTVTRLMAVVGLLVLAMGAMLGWLVLNRVVIGPMRAVHGGMQALRRSEFAHRVNLRTGDEFQALGDTFNHLARELNAARSVQASFAPKDIPSGDGWQIAAISAPCEATAGDYVDAFELPDGRGIAVVVADVTGHGLGPALLMSACRSTLRALAATGRSPCEVVDTLDAMLSADLTEGRFITLIFGVLLPDGRFTYCNAGHGPTLVVSKGVARSLETHRPPVGLNWRCDDGQGESVLNLSPGDRLLLASDGVIEAWNDRDEQFGNERLEALAIDTTRPPPAAARGVLEAVTTHRGRRAQSDDVTILCVDRR